MAIAVNANVTRGDIASVTATTTVTKPTGTASTDILILFFGDDTGQIAANNVITPASGWTAINTATAAANGSNNNAKLAGFWSLGSNSSLGFSNSKTGAQYQQGWIMLGFTGVDNTTPIDATGTISTTTTNVASITANAVTVATDQAWEVIGVCGWNGGTWTATGFTVKQNVASPPAINADAAILYNTTPKAVGSTGTVSCASSASSTGQAMVAMPFALRPAAGGAAVQPPIGAYTRVNRVVSPFQFAMMGAMAKELTRQRRRKRRGLCY